jgi:hypothetical protein
LFLWGVRLRIILYRWRSPGVIVDYSWKARACAAVRVPLADAVFATGLRLADGTTWSCAVTGDGSKTIVRRLADIMQLRPMTGPCDASVVVTSGEPLCRDSSASLDVRVASCLADISLAVAEAVQARGGLLLHGGLAENQPGGYGAILAGPSDAGKSTASRRLHWPWRSLSDDAVLVVRDRGGAYWAHPWPTRSAFLPWGSGGSWDVGYAVLLKGIFYLERGEYIHAERLGPGRAACLLTQSAEQALWPSGLSYPQGHVRRLRGERFSNVCALAQAVPAFHLRMDRVSPFWEAMAQAVGNGREA